MKQVVYIRKEKVTLNTIAKDCEKHGRLISLVRDPFLNGYRKYYSFTDAYAHKRIMEVTEADGKVISVRPVPENVVKTLPPLNVPKFGDF